MRKNMKVTAVISLFDTPVLFMYSDYAVIYFNLRKRTSFGQGFLYLFCVLIPQPGSGAVCLIDATRHTCNRLVTQGHTSSREKFCE